MSKVYVLMACDYYYNDALDNVYETRESAMKRAKELADEKVINRTDRKIEKVYNPNGIENGYRVKWFDDIEGYWETDWVFCVVEKEVLKD